MGAVISWLIVGAIAGGIASLIVPGRTPGGAIGAIIVGIIGGLIGGWILDALDVSNNLSWIGSLIVAVIGATIILFALRQRGDRAAGGGHAGRRV